MVHHIPNILTIFRIAVTPVFIYTFFLPGLVWKIIALLIFIFSTVTDKFDGFLARRYGWETDLGKYLDPLADKILITSAFVCLIGYNYIDLWMVAVIVMRDVFVTWLRSYGIKLGKPVSTLEIARWKTAVQTVAVYIALVFMIAKVMLSKTAVTADVIRSLEDMHFVWIIMLITTLFTLITGIFYFLENRHLFKAEA